MHTYVLRSIFRAIVTMFLVMTIVFVALRFAPVDPTQFILGDYASPEALDALREEMGLNRPIYHQYFTFLNRLFHGDLGRSFINKQLILPQLYSVLPYTLELVVLGVFLDTKF